MPLRKSLRPKATNEKVAIHFIIGTGSLPVKLQLPFLVCLVGVQILLQALLSLRVTQL